MGELVLDGEVGGGGGGERREKLGEFREERGEGDGAVDGHDTGVAADVAELVVVRTREDFAAEATHQPDNRLVVLRRYFLVD